MATLSPWRVFGLGSAHGDDAVGWAVARRLADLPFLKGQVKCIASPYDLIMELAPDARVIVVDACRTGAAPGTIVRVSAAELTAVPRSVGRSTHGGSWAEVWRLAQVLNRLPAEAWLFGIETEACDPGTTVSGPARAAVESVVSEIARRVTDDAS